MSNSEKIVAFPDLPDMENEAAVWVARISDGELSEDELSDFRSWLSKSDQHKVVFDRFAAFWDGDLSLLKQLDDFAESAKSADVPRWRQVSRRSYITAAAASIAAAFMGVLAYQYLGTTEHLQSAVYTTNVGGQKLVELPDGSQIQLNTDSAVEVTYERAARDIRLVRGEAHFDVVSDPDRPFSVFAGDGVVQAVGTAFAVRLRAQAVEVTVTEGRVALATQTAPDRNSAENRTPVGPSEQSQARALAEISAGQNVIFDRKIEHIEVLVEADLSRKLSWRQGILAFAGEPLSEVVADISRYTDIKIEISDPALKELPVGGYFRVGDIEEMLTALEVNFGLQVERVGRKHIRILRSS